MTEKKAHPLHRAWAAGVFEARCQWPASGYTLRIESWHEPLITRFAEVVDVGRIEISYSKVKANYIFKTGNMDDTRTLLLCLSPFFTGHKLAQATDMIGRIERNPIWRKQNPEKASSCVISPAPTAEAETTEDSTQADGQDASDVEKTGDPKETT